MKCRYSNGEEDLKNREVFIFHVCVPLFCNKTPVSSHCVEGPECQLSLAVHTCPPCLKRTIEAERRPWGHINSWGRTILHVFYISLARANAQHGKRGHDQPHLIPYINPILSDTACRHGNNTLILIVQTEESLNPALHKFLYLSFYLQRHIKVTYHSSNCNRYCMEQLQSNQCSENNLKLTLNIWPCVWTWIRVDYYWMEVWQKSLTAS